MKHLILFALTAGLAAAATTTALPAPGLFDCPLECLTPGSANQAVCAPVAAQLSVTVDEGFGVIHIGNSAYNGTVVRSVSVLFQDLTMFNSPVYVHSNDGEGIVMITGGGPVDVRQVSLDLDGIGGPGRITRFATCWDCGGAPTPEPRYTWGLVPALAALCLKLGLGEREEKGRP